MVVISTQKKALRGHSKALPRIDLNQPGRVRVGHMMTFYGISHSSVYAHLKKGLLPPPDGFICRRPYWLTSTIKADLEKRMPVVKP
jgi:predicted DNA-binding transcriptional regulator AlpA